MRSSCRFGGNSICRWTGPSSTDCSQAEPRNRIDIRRLRLAAACALLNARAFPEVGLHQCPSDKRPKESRFAASTSPLTSPCPRRLPQKRGALRPLECTTETDFLRWREMDSNPRSLYVIREPTAG